MTGTGYFAGKSALVTGAASGIGREIARQLVASGASVLLTDVDEASVLAAAQEIGANNDLASAMRVDVSKREEIAAAIQQVVAQHGSIDLIFNNAGVAIFGDVQHVSLDEWDKIIDVNLRGVAYGSTLAYIEMLKHRSGHIVNTASIAGLTAVPLQAHYCATKHGVVGLSKTLAVEASERGVYVTVFCPGFVDTGMMENNTMHGTLSGVDARQLLPFPPLHVEPAVKKLLAGVAAKREMVIVPFYGRFVWWFERFSPTLSFHAHRATLWAARRRIKSKR